jgi:hypothetical protein
MWLAFSWNKPSVLDGCPTPSSIHRFCDATDKSKPTWFWDPNQETVAVILRPKSTNRSCRFWCPNRETVTLDFEAKQGETVTTGFEAKPLINSQPCFWGSIKKPALLVSTCMVQTTHSVIRLLDHPTIEYPTCATIPDPLHQVSYSYHDPCRCTPCRACHMHTTREATRFSTWYKDKSKTTKISQIRIQTSPS